MSWRATSRPAARRPPSLKYTFWSPSATMSRIRWSSAPWARRRTGGGRTPGGGGPSGVGSGRRRSCRSARCNRTGHGFPPWYLVRRPEQRQPGSVHLDVQRGHGDAVLAIVDTEATLETLAKRPHLNTSAPNGRSALVADRPAEQLQERLEQTAVRSAGAGEGLGPWCSGRRPTPSPAPGGRPCRSGWSGCPDGTPARRGWRHSRW